VHYKDTVKHTDNKGIHRQTQQEAPTLSSTLEEAKPPPKAARKQHALSQKSSQQRNNRLQPPITANHDLTRWRDPHPPISGERSPHMQTTHRQERTTRLSAGDGRSRIRFYGTEKPRSYRILQMLNVTVFISFQI